MTDVFNAIYTHYSGTQLASILTELYNTLGPEKPTYPYGVYSLISNVPDWTFTEETEELLLQFNLFSRTSDSAQICNVFEQLKTAFDFAEFVMDSFELISITRVNAILLKEEKVWQYNVTYRLLIGKK